MSAPCDDKTDTSKEEENDVFRDVFKYYKRKNPPPDLTKVLDFENISADGNREVFRVPVTWTGQDSPAIHGMMAPEQWKVYMHTSFPGFMFIHNPFLPGCHRYWVKRCIEDYPCSPSQRNLDAHMELGQKDNIWHMSQKERLEKNYTNFDKTLIHKLRWTTLGYHHDWNTKFYLPDSCSPFPADLSLLSSYIASILGFPSFQAEASIINYYHINSTLAGHTDHSEFDYQAPLLSVSFGLPAVFLLGGTTRNVQPIAMYVRSGDIVIMSGKSRLAYHAVPKILTRKDDSSLHHQLGEATNIHDKTTDTPGVITNDPGETTGNEAIVIPGADDHSSCRCQEGHRMVEDHCIKEINMNILRTLETLEWTDFALYLSSSRINMNVRQVFKPGETFPIN